MKSLKQILVNLKRTILSKNKITIISKVVTLKLSHQNSYQKKKRKVKISIPKIIKKRRSLAKGLYTQMQLRPKTKIINILKTRLNRKYRKLNKKLSSARRSRNPKRKRISFLTYS